MLGIYVEISQNKRRNLYCRSLQRWKTVFFFRHLKIGYMPIQRVEMRINKLKQLQFLLTLPLVSLFSVGLAFSQQSTPRTFKFEQLLKVVDDNDASSIDDLLPLLSIQSK